MQWIEVHNKSTGKQLPAWARSAGLAEDGTAFVPAAIGGNEQAAVLSASWDGVDMALYKKHPFLPAPWVAKEYPKARDLSEKIARSVHEALDSSPTM